MYVLSYTLSLRYPVTESSQRTGYEFSGVPAAMPLLCNNRLSLSETVASIKRFLLEVALVEVFYPSNGKVIKKDIGIREQTIYCSDGPDHVCLCFVLFCFGGCVFKNLQEFATLD